MNSFLLHINPTQIISAVFVIAALLLLYQYLETFWSYKISKPHTWEEAVKKKQVSKDLVRIERGFRDKVRFYNFWFQVEQLKNSNVTGAFAELGVHKGGSAKAIHFMDQERKFYLFDTFEGFPARDLKQETQADARFSTEMFSDTSVEQVQAFINGNENVIFRSGFFPDTAAGLENEKFALVNIDADLYAPTIAALRFFYPRMSVGGVIIIHDYNHTWDGISKAVDEFIPAIPESLVELPDWQGSAMIIKSSD